MNINIRKIGALLLLLFSIFTLAACQNITEEVTVESIQVEISTLNPNYNVDDFDLSTISIRVTFSDGKFQIIPITESMLTKEHLSLLSNVGEHQITITYQGKSTTINLNLQYDSLKTQLMTLYTLSTTSGSFSGTYEEWLETVRGPQGNPGREVTFQVANGFIQWQYVGGSSWTNLVELTSLVGPAGQDGVDGINGKEVTFRVSEGFIQWQYLGEVSWNNLVALSTLTGSDGLDGINGTDGKEVTFQVANGFIQWQYVGGSSWTNLVELTSLVGPAGQDGVDGINGKEVTFRVSEGFIQWQYLGEVSWNNLVALSTLTGSDGLDGINGTDGKEVTFQVANGFIQWQYVGGSSWTNLVELTSLVGPAGQDGVDGINGKEVTFRVSEGFIQWQYLGEVSWNNLVALSTLTGSDGLDGINGTDGTNYGENISASAVTKNFSSYVFGLAAVLAIIISFTPLASFAGFIPAAVVNGASIYLFGVIAAQGIALIIDKKVDLFNTKNLAVISLVFVIGLGGHYAMPNGGFPLYSVGGNTVYFPALALAAILGILLNAGLGWLETKAIK